MTVGATAITIFHPPSEPQRFARWVAVYLASARHASGYVAARESVQSDGRLDRGLDWAIEISFDSAERLDAWFDSAERQHVLAEGESQGFWRCASDLILADGELPPANAGVFLHSVAPGKEAEFVRGAERPDADQFRLPRIRLHRPASRGYLRALESVLRFRTARHLAGWIRSSERQNALPRLRGELTRDFSELPRSAPFGSTVRVADGETLITPAWKSALLVVLCLYPTVMLLSRFQAPALARLGITAPLSVFVGNVISVVLLQWVLVPAASRPFRRWLDPIDGAAGGISLAGAAVVGVGYAVLLLLLSFVG